MPININDEVMQEQLKEFSEQLRKGTSARVSVALVLGDPTPGPEPQHIGVGISSTDGLHPVKAQLELSKALAVLSQQMMESGSLGYFTLAIDVVDKKSGKRQPLQVGLSDTIVKSEPRP